MNDVLIFQARLKELEQEAHFVAGEQFLITSNNQLREVRINFFFFETVSHSVAQTCLELPSSTGLYAHSNSGQFSCLTSQSAEIIARDHYTCLVMLKFVLSKTVLLKNLKNGLF